MRFKGVLTFESNTQAPKVHRMDLEAGSASGAAPKLIRAARKAYPGARWESLCIILEKVEKEPE
jgi:hypothetical protein